MSLLNVAVYDATVAACNTKYIYNRSRSEQAVVAGAASTILGYIYPDLAQDFLDKAQKAANSRVAARASFPSDVAAELALGTAIAEQVIAHPD